MSGPDDFDEAAFRGKMPFALRATRTPRAFRVPLPRPGFEPGRATAEELRALGMRWRRSVANRNPVAAALWRRVEAHRFTEGDDDGAPARWMPPMHRATPPEGGGTDYNWAGPVLPSGNWTGIISSWVVPTLSAPAQPATTITYPNGESFTGWWVSSWVGLDGYQFINSNDLLQIGVMQQIDTQGNAFAWGWYEWWVLGAPAAVIATFPFVNAQAIPQQTFAVNPGDEVIAAVSYATDSAGNVTGGQVTLSNVTQPTANFYSRVLPKPTGAQANGACAEWIVECPGGGETGLYGQPVYSLANFGSIDFSAALACNCSGDLSDIVWGDPTTASIVNLETGGTPPTVLTATTVGTGTATVSFVGG